MRKWIILCGVLLLPLIGWVGVWWQRLRNVAALRDGVEAALRRPIERPVHVEPPDDTVALRLPELYQYGDFAGCPDEQGRAQPAGKTPNTPCRFTPGEREAWVRFVLRASRASRLETQGDDLVGNAGSPGTRYSSWELGNPMRALAVEEVPELIDAALFEGRGEDALSMCVDALATHRDTALALRVNGMEKAYALTSLLEPRCRRSLAAVTDESRRRARKQISIIGLARLDPQAVVLELGLIRELRAYNDEAAAAQLEWPRGVTVQNFHMRCGNDPGPSARERAFSALYTVLYSVPIVTGQAAVHTRLVALAAMADEAGSREFLAAEAVVAAQLNEKPTVFSDALENDKARCTLLARLADSSSNGD